MIIILLFAKIIILIYFICMDISGIVKELLSARSYRGKDGSDVRIYGFVLHIEGQYPKDIAFSVFGDVRWSKMKDILLIGREVSVLFDVSSRKWKDGWFTQCDAFSVRSLGGSSSSRTSSVPSSDNVPF